MSVVIQIPSHSKSFTYFFWYCLKWQHILVLIFFHTKKICLPILCQFFYTGNWARKKRNTNSLPYREVHLQWSLNYHLRIEYLSFYYMIIFFHTVPVLSHTYCLGVAMVPSGFLLAGLVGLTRGLSGHQKREKKKELANFK